MIRIVKEKIDIEEVLNAVEDPSAGGIDVFIGTMRNISAGKTVLSLEYEAYEEMALSMMERISAEATGRWGLKKVAIVHRVGKVGIGEASIVVAVSAEHRKEAFEGCRFIIDSVKKDAPIWKKEYYSEGSAWIGVR
jgi:molybdopterin synthase catalytic subunit